MSEPSLESLLLAWRAAREREEQAQRRISQREATDIEKIPGRARMLTTGEDARAVLVQARIERLMLERRYLDAYKQRRRSGTA